MVEPRLGRAAAGLLLPVARDGDDEGFLAALLSPQLGGHLIAVHPRKADVEDHGLGFVFSCGLDGIRSAMGHPDRVARELQELGHPVGRVLVVIDDEDSQAAGG